MARFQTALPGLKNGYFSRTTLSAAMYGLPHGSALADYKKRSPPVAIRYGKGLMGGAVVIALLALLVHWIGINTIEHYRDDLLFYRKLI